MARWLGLQPRWPAPVEAGDQPDPTPGLPCLAAQLAQRFDGPGQGKEGLLQLLKGRNVSCYTAYWAMDADLQLYPMHYFIMPGKRDPVNSAQQVVRWLGLAPRIVD